jgi:hypothetical protein
VFVVPAKEASMRRLFVLVALACLLSAEAAAQDEATHINRPIGDLIQLRALQAPAFSNPFLCFTTRLLPDGTEQGNFVVPVNRVLVVTDVEFRLQGGSPGHSVRLSLERDHPEGGPTNFPLIGPMILVPNAAGDASYAANMTTGFVVGPGVRLCVSIESALGFDAVIANIQGYMVPTPGRRVPDTDQ